MKLNCCSSHIVIFAVIFSFSLPVHAAFKCWKNAEGIRECGTSIPPEFAQKGHEIINPMGIKVGEGKHAKTDEERAEEERLKAEAEARIRKEAAEEQRIRQQKHEDSVLLSTYTSEQEINTSRDEKIHSIEAYIKQTENHVVKLKKNLKQLRERAAQMERAKGGVTEKQQEAIKDVNEQIAKNKKYIAERKLKQQELRESYGKQLKRFKELKAMGAN